MRRIRYFTFALLIVCFVLVLTACSLLDMTPSDPSINANHITEGAPSDETAATAVTYMEVTTHVCHQTVLEKNNPNGGEVLGAGTYIDGEPVTITATTNNGYLWLGWFDGETLLTDDESYTFTMPDEAIVYTAKWDLKEYTVTYRLDDGTNSPDNPLSFTVEDDDIVLIVPEKANYDFAGWMIDSETVTAIDTSLAKDLTIQAVWTPTVFPIVYNLDGGTNNENNPSQYTVETEVILADPSRTGYSFDGWSNSGVVALGSTGEKTFTANWTPNTDTLYTVEYYLQNAAGTGYAKAEEATESKTGTTDTPVAAEQKVFQHYSYNQDRSISEGGIAGDGSLVLKMYYDRDCYTVTFIANGGTLIGGNDVQTIRYGNPVSFPTFSRNGYSFESWDSTDGCDAVAQDLTITANWTVNTYSVTYDLNGGTMSESNPASYTIEDDVELAEPTQQELYRFLGWYSQNGERIDNLNGRYESLTLTARWEIPFIVENGMIVGISDYVRETFTEIEIPSVFEGTTITTIGNRALVDYAKLKTIVIPDSVTTIRQYAFNGCTGLTSVTLGNGVTAIGDSAFRNCSALASFTIPDCVTSIGENAFNGCSSLTSVAIGNGVTSIGRYAFYGCSGLTSVTIPDSVTSIGQSTFTGCSGLTSVTIGDGVKNMGSYAFSGCTEIIHATIPTIAISSLPKSQLQTVVITSGSSIPANAFSGCSNLTVITIPDSVTSIGGKAFFKCSGLTEIVLPDSVTSIGEAILSGCSSLERITIPFVGDRAGIDSSSLNRYPFGYLFGTAYFDGGTATAQTYYASAKSPSAESVYYIPTSLQSVTVSGGYIPFGAFYNCANLTSVAIGNGVTQIGGKAFYGCSGINKVYYLGEVAEWCDIIFDEEDSNPIKLAVWFYFGDTFLINGDTFLIDLEIPEGVTQINDYAFAGYCRLRTVSIPDSVTTIGVRAFYGCYNIEAVTIGAGITSIGASAFEGCDYMRVTYYSGNRDDWFGITFGNAYANPLSGSHLLMIDNHEVTYVGVPENVTEINDFAFYGCTSIRHITIHRKVTSIGNDAFTGCSSIELALIPAFAIKYLPKAKLHSVWISCGEIEKKAFAGCAELTTIEIQKNVTAIGESAFKDCPKLTSVEWNTTNLSYVGSATNPIFSGCSKLTTVTFGDDAEIIPAYAFYGCTGLTSVTISDSVTGIGTQAFAGCISLASITIPDSVTRIGSWAFSGCTDLTSITIPDSVTTIEQYAFRSCTGLTSVTIGNSVTSINSYAFYECYKLIEVHNLSALNITGGESGNGYVGYYAKHVFTDGESYLHTYNNVFLFYDDGTDVYLISYSGSHQLYLPNDFNGKRFAIYQYAFYNCSGLTSVTIGNGVTSIGQYAFSGCSGLTSVIWNATNCTLAGSASNPIFSDCLNLTTVTFGDNVETIPAYAFYGCLGLTSVTIGNSVTSINSYAFYECYKLIEVHNLSALNIKAGESGNGYVGYYAKHVYKNGESFLSRQYDCLFYDDGNEVFLISYLGCETELTLPNRFKGKDYAIYRYAFCKRSELTSVIIPDSVTSIGTCAFYYCSTLTSVTIGNSVTSIEYGAFYYCSKLTSVTIGNSVTSIGSGAFYNCSKLTSITIPDSVTSIENDAFYRCSKLTSVYYTGDIAGWCGITFGSYYGNPLYYAHSLYINNELVTELVIPDDVASIGQYAFYYCTGLTAVTIGNGVTSIGNHAFQNCSGLTSVTIPDGVT
ncbi:MAG: leucine-rich repeat protein, partial [Lachnospiraceae bacterium]|nr:leucine-rich repeat protein [Lachnospiraceae bacterium]